MRRIHFNHGKLHRPGGADPTPAGEYHYIGDPGEPDFENGWGNIPASGDVPNPQPMYYRLVVGAKNVMDEDGNIVQYTNHVIEISGDVTGGDDATTVFTLPLPYTFPNDKPVPAHDVDGNYLPSRLFSNGEYVRGIP